MVSLSKAQFDKDLQHGKLGEKWFHDYCIERGLLCIPVGDDNFLGIESGIDFIVQYPSGTIAKFDAKLDSRMAQTGNMFIEIYQDTGKKGWFYNSKANRYCYIDEVRKMMYMFSKNSLILYMNQNKDDLSTVSKWIDGKTVVGVLVNVESFKQWCNIKHRKIIEYQRMDTIEDIENEETADIVEVAEIEFWEVA